MNIAQWIVYAKQYLTENLTNDPYLNAKTDSYLLLQFVTGYSKSQLMAFNDRELSKENCEKLTALLERRAKGEPMAYILGETEFWSLNLKVSPDTLIPRPDTEMLVEHALNVAKEKIQQKGKVSILDLGTGTGAIALAIADELKKCGTKYRILGVDLVAGAVALARQNAEQNDLLDVEFQQGSWFQNITEHFDIIVSNPPYIDPQDPHLQQGDVRFEPLSALIAEDQGYADLQKIIAKAPQFLQPQGWLLLEHGWQQGKKVRSFLTENLWLSVQTVKDYGGNERVTLARLK
ncbi:peptide chain release factor N(5)-glutamine methyltransferase [Lonepinella koalarum]|uniref:peptide chain release factor N(5)-glutamine methyltransferase n=1 Tax=Lonepinella koalarum TaxID=53417 RepID=UPI0011E4B803|nr:peptide chain release factor N(5)-glutamine methyltransferase [Lonepinella koalarum]TYG33732.1 peptide chain release factor N(5)-glutamine methyltransferase [Lonepinella koalarum]